MAYEKRTWVSGVTKCSAENFNHMEDGIETAQKGVDELNTKLDRTGTYASNIYLQIEGGYTGSILIPLTNADKYNIEITKISMFGQNIDATFPWDIIKYKNGFYLQINNMDAKYFFGTAHPNKLWTVYFKVS